MEKIAEVTGLQVEQLSKYGLYAGIFFVMFGVGANYITCLLGVAYPVFMSFLALESEGGEDDKQWLTYWVVFGLFNILDHFAGFVLAWIPFYYFLKLGFLVFLFHPTTKGATWVYNNFILPHIDEYNSQLDAAHARIAGLAGQAKDSVSGLADQAKDSVSGLADQAKDKVLGKSE